MKWQMKRKMTAELSDWFQSNDRFPLIIRGPRQVGKSTTVRNFAIANGIDYFEINLEREKYHTLLEEKIQINDLIDEIESKFKRRPKKNSLLFFDEIQEVPALISILRYFYEDFKDFAVISAGSLLELVIKKEEISFPVGRVRFLYMVPMLFTEFLDAIGEEKLSSHILDNTVKKFMHEDLLKHLKKYFYIGGMPKAVSTYIETNSLLKVREVQLDIIETYSADFPKYGKRIDYKRIERVFKECAYQVGRKVIYQNFDRESKSREIKNALELLADAMVITQAYHCECGGLPLDSTMSQELYKIYFIDIGLMNALHKIDFHHLEGQFENILITKGQMAEQFIAQHLQLFNGNRTRPELRYWLRDKGSAKAEVDFVVQKNEAIIPIEVKAEQGGRLRSLIVFASEKKWDKAIVFNGRIFENYKINGTNKNPTISVSNIPLYLVEIVTFRSIFSDLSLS